MGNYYGASLKAALADPPGPTAPGQLKLFLNKTQVLARAQLRMSHVWVQENVLSSHAVLFYMDLWALRS